MNEYKVEKTNNGKYMVVWRYTYYNSSIWHLDTDFRPTEDKAEADAYAARRNKLW